jgi:amidophosphoribosyltransferase
MMLKEMCGVVGIYSPNVEEEVSGQLYCCLMALQHRGQESAGISVYDGERVRNFRAPGLAAEVFTPTVLQRLKGHVGIAHVRYSTKGRSDLKNSQPYFTKKSKIGFSIATNGNIVNYEKLKARLTGEGYRFETTSDFEVIAHLLSSGLKDGGDWCDAVEHAMGQLMGSYSLVILTEKGELIAARDPLGFRPLCLGKLSETYVIASETAALDSVGASLVKEVEPGEVVLIDESGMHAKKLISSNRHAHCMFEWVYFARADSDIEGISVHKVRERLGQNLARIHPVEKGTIIVPVPDSGRSTASGFAIGSNSRALEGFIKNRYVGRTFIMPHQKDRENSTHLKFNPIKSIVSGKRVALVDDSIVRGTTLRRLVSSLRCAGAKEVHVRISCPPIKFPCVFGIDFPTFEELIASNKTIPEIQKEIGADSLGYQTIEGLIEAIGCRRDELCLACLTGEYPTQLSSELISWERLREKNGLDERSGKKGE